MDKQDCTGKLKLQSFAGRISLRLLNHPREQNVIPKILICGCGDLAKALANICAGSQT
jgi:hypothetical protein